MELSEAELAFDQIKEFLLDGTEHGYIAFDYDGVRYVLEAHVLLKEHCQNNELA